MKHYLSSIFAAAVILAGFAACNSDDPVQAEDPIEEIVAPLKLHPRWLIEHPTYEAWDTIVSTGVDRLTIDSIQFTPVMKYFGTDLVSGSTFTEEDLTLSFNDRKLTVSFSHSDSEEEGHPVIIHLSGPIDNDSIICWRGPGMLLGLDPDSYFIVTPEEVYMPAEGGTYTVDISTSAKYWDEHCIKIDNDLASATNYINEYHAKDYIKDFNLETHDPFHYDGAIEWVRFSRNDDRLTITIEPNETDKPRAFYMPLDPPIYVRKHVCKQAAANK